MRSASGDILFTPTRTLNGTESQSCALSPLFQEECVRADARRRRHLQFVSQLQPQELEWLGLLEFPGRVSRIGVILIFTEVELPHFSRLGRKIDRIQVNPKCIGR